MTDPRVRFLAGVSEDDIADVLRLLDSPTIRVTAVVPLTEWRHQVLLCALVDLLGRLFPRLDIDIDPAAPAASLLPPGGTTIGDRLDAVRRRSPLVPLPPGGPDLTVHVGPGCTGAEVYVDASEWQSYLGRRPSRLEAPRRDTAVGPLAAACRAAAQVYSMLLRSVREPLALGDETYISALTYRISSDPLDEPEPSELGPLDALVVGAGSVGGGAAYTMSYEPHLAGRLIACDPQNLDDTNPFRAILATADAAANHAPKAHEFKAALAHHEALSVDAQVKTMTEWEADQDCPPVLPLVLVAVDTLESREFVQDALPLELVNAAVGPDLVAVSGHCTGSGPCMCCLHMPQVLDAQSIKNRLIAVATGLAQQQVNELRVRSIGLDAGLLRRIEHHRRLEHAALAHYEGKVLDELYNAEILYGETEVRTAGGTRVAVAAPFVTALAGVLLSAEVFKRSTPALARYALGPRGPGIQYRENPYAPEHGIVDGQIPRSAICLCRSMRRLRLLANLHGLDLGTLNR